MSNARKGRVIRPEQMDFETLSPSGPTRNYDMPMDLPFDESGQISPSGLVDNQVYRTKQGRFGRFSAEVGQLVPSIFDIDKDQFVAENYKTPAGFAAIGRRLTSGIADLNKYALDTGDSDVLAAAQKMQRDVDAIDASDLRPEERDRAILSVYEQNRNYFDLIDAARVQTSQQQIQTAAMESQRELQVAEFKMNEALELANASLYKQEDGAPLFGDAVDYTIPDEDIENAYKAMMSKKEAYDSAFDEAYGESGDYHSAHNHAFVTAGLGTVQDAQTQGRGALFTDRLQFESNYRARNGMSRRNAHAMAEIGKAISLTEARIDAVAQGPLSVETQRTYVTNLVNAGVAPDVANQMYFENTLYHQSTMFREHKNLLTLRRQRESIAYLEERVVGDITNAEVLQFATSRNIDPAAATAMIKRMYLDDLLGTTPYKVRNKRQDAEARRKARVDVPRDFGGV